VRVIWISADEELARTCMKALNRGIWRKSISLSAKLRLYNVRADTWSMTAASKRRLDAFHQWCLRYILHIPFTAHVKNQEVCSRTGQPPVSLVKSRRLKLLAILREQNRLKTMHAQCEFPSINLSIYVRLLKDDKMHLRKKSQKKNYKIQNI